MKKLILLLFIPLFVLAPRLQAQNFWEQLPFPDTLDITCVAVNNEGVIFVTTNTTNKYDGIFRSTDSGQTWQQVFNSWFGSLSITIDTEGKIYSIFYLDSEQVLISSIDLGTSWDTLPMPSYGDQLLIRTHGTDTLYVSQWKPVGAILLRSTNSGLTWSVLFETFNVSESVRDIEIAPNGNIYIGLMGYFNGQGGIYKSADNGVTWQYMGLQGYQVRNIEINAQGDIFIGARDMGTYAIYHDNPETIIFLNGAVNEGLVLNSVGHIYINTQWPDGTSLSKDNGNSFAWVSNGTLNGPNGQLFIDSQDYLYGIFNSGLPNLYRTKEPTYTGINTKEFAGKTQLIIYPNPAKDILNCRFLQNSIIGEKCILSIVDINNRIAYQEETLIDSDSYKLNIAHLPSGLYCLNFTFNQEMVTAKFVKL